MLTIQGKSLTLSATPEKATFTVTLKCGDVWTMSGRPYVELTDGSVYYLDEAPVAVTERHTSTWRGMGADYALGCGLTLHTLVYIENTRDDLYFVSRLEGDTPGQVRRVSFPAAVDFDGTEEGHGYTILPRMQGTLIPSAHPIPPIDGLVFERNAYMPMFGQVRDGSGYLAVYDTPYDAEYFLRGENVSPLFRTSLGRMSYPRRMLYRFMEDCDYNDLAHSYRAYLEERGEIVTLAQKCVQNPAVERLIGAPVCCPPMVAVHIHPQSYYYKPDAPTNNDFHTTFDEIGRSLTALRKRGLTRCYVHQDGWGFHGYDTRHPSPLPPNEEAGGAEGMKRLSDTARALGYMFGIHDQYRDYYYDSPDFDFNNAIQNLDGSHPYETTWYGGPQTILCASLAEDYVRRNYDEFERLGITIEGAYLDVFSVIYGDECFNPEHPMTREQCMRARSRCLAHLTSRGIIPSSEETLGCMMDTQVLCHHAPFYTSSLGASDALPVGVPIPLFNLVYHDCVVIPWGGLKGTYGGWGIPGNDSAYLYAWLNGNPPYCPIDATEEQIQDIQAACASAEKLAKQRMVKHKFLDGGYRKQCTVWEDGTVVEIDPDQGTYKITK